MERRGRKKLHPWPSSSTDFNFVVRKERTRPALFQPFPLTTSPASGRRGGGGAEEASERKVTVHFSPPLFPAPNVPQCVISFAFARRTCSRLPQYWKSRSMRIRDRAARRKNASLSTDRGDKEKSVKEKFSDFCELFFLFLELKRFGEMLKVAYFWREGFFFSIQVKEWNELGEFRCFESV